MLAVGEDQLTDELSLVRALLHNGAVLPQKVANEELIEVLLELLLGQLGDARQGLVAGDVLIDRLSQVHAEVEGSFKAVLHRAQVLEHHNHVSEEDDHVVR